LNSKRKYPWFLILLRDLLILVMIGNALSIFFVPREMWSITTVLRNCMFSIMLGYPSWKGMAFIIVILDRRIPWLKFPIKRLIIQFLSLTLGSSIIFFVGISIWIWFTEDLSFSLVIEFITPSLKVVYIFMILVLILGNTVLFFKNWRKAAIQQEELKRAHLTLQYQSLKSQIKPHFLFNSLNSLVSLINSDAKKATLFVHKLADVYRYVLDQGESELVPLAEERKFLEDYIYLQKIRFGENLQVAIDLEQAGSQLVIPLSLQMMVENAIKHNEISAEHPLQIRIYQDKEARIIVSNKLNKKEILDETPGVGLANLRKRIAFFTDDSLDVVEGSGEFRVTIPPIRSQTVKP
jgi:sensor histidine kinase YesM